MLKLLITIISFMGCTNLFAQLTLDRCMEMAIDNYPLIEKYNLLTVTEDIDISDINKSWLPRIDAYAQGSVQNVVPSFPSALTNVMSQMGNDIRGLDKLQYKAGVDVAQTIWDGGASRAQREVTRRRTQVERAALDVEMYAIRQRVQSIYFGILLMQSQIERTQAAMEVYDANLQRLRSMLANGIAMQTDVDMVEAQQLTVVQQLTQARTALKSYCDMLSIFIGEEVGDDPLPLPVAEMPLDMTSLRPELSLFDHQLSLNDARRDIVAASLLPKVNFFAQGYYGYPGIDYFKAMMERNPSFNAVAGIKVAWSISPFYTRKNSLRKIDVADKETNADRAAFIFNNNMQIASQKVEIEGIKQLMTDDQRIIDLRRNVRVAAESQLRNGIIDATTLIAKINDETQSQLAASYHNIQYLQAIYNLKNLLNR